MLHYRSSCSLYREWPMSFVFHRRTASFRRQIDENSRSSSGPGLRLIPGQRSGSVSRRAECRNRRQSGFRHEISCILVRPDELEFVRLRTTARSLSISESPARCSAVWATPLPRVTPASSRQAQHRSGEREHAPVSAEELCRGDPARISQNLTRQPLIFGRRALQRLAARPPA